MKLDTWQVRLLVQALEAAAYIRQGYVERASERLALRVMAAALESGESLEVGP